MISKKLFFEVSVLPLGAGPHPAFRADTWPEISRGYAESPSTGTYLPSGTVAYQGYNDADVALIPACAGYNNDASSGASDWSCFGAAEAEARSQHRRMGVLAHSLLSDATGMYGELEATAERV